MKVSYQERNYLVEWNHETRELVKVASDEEVKALQRRLLKPFADGYRLHISSIEIPCGLVLTRSVETTTCLIRDADWASPGDGTSPVIAQATVTRYCLDTPNRREARRESMLKALHSIEAKTATLRRFRVRCFMDALAAL